MREAFWNRPRSSGGRFAHESNVAELIERNVLPKDSPFEGVELRNYEIVHRRINGETLSSIGVDFGLTREAIRQIVQKTYGYDADEEIRKRRAKKASIADEILVEIENFIMGHKGIKLSELRVHYPDLDDSSLRLLKTSALNFVDREKINKSVARVWEDDEILTALIQASTYFFPLASSDYQRLLISGEIRGPSTALVTQRFGSWKVACARAGVESRRSNAETSYQKKWTSHELISFVCEFLESATPSTGIAHYEKWRNQSCPHAPSGQLLRTTFGGWNQVVSHAQQEFRNGWAQVHENEGH